MKVDSAPFVFLLCGRTIMRMLGVAMSCGCHAAPMMVTDHPFGLGVVLRQT